MPAETEKEQKFPPTENKVFVGNTIGLRIDHLAGEAQDNSLKQRLKKSICDELGWGSVKLGRVLNNIDQPSTPQLVAIAQLLKTTTDGLIKTKPVAAAA